MSLVLLLLVAVGVVAAVRYGPLAGEVRGLRDAAQRLSAEARALEPAQLDRATVDRLRDGITDLDQRLEPFRGVIEGDPLVEVARRLPVIGEQVGAGVALVSAADSLVEAGDLGLDVAERFVTLREADAADPARPLLPDLVELMATSTDEVDRIGELVADANARLAEIGPGAIGQVREARDLVAEPLAQYTPLLERYRELDDVLPGILGYGDRKRYLVLAQNPAELRSTGGYAGTVGVVAFEDGAVVEQWYRDVNELDLQAHLPFIEAPPELRDHLLGSEQSWRLADAAWAADFPEGAQKSLEFFELEANDADIDGVIAVTTYALDRILEVVGPVEVPDFGVTVRPGDTTLTLLGETRGTETSVVGRKRILGSLATIAMQRLLTLPPEQWVPMAEAVVDIGRQKLALAWLKDPAVQQVILESGWAGQVHDDPGDYVYALESNVAPTSKYNLVVDRSASLLVDVAEDGSALDSLRLDWLNRAGDQDAASTALREYSENEEGWYGAYLRLLLPPGSTLVTANGQAAEEISGAATMADEAGRPTHGNYLFMPPGASTMSYLWTTPDAAVQVDDGWEYRLLVQKQPGARPEPWSIRIDLPEGATVTSSPEGAVVEGERVSLDTVLDEDRQIVVRYQLP